MAPTSIRQKRRIVGAVADTLLGLLKSWTRTTAFISKEVREVIRRPGALFSLIFGPFVIMGVFGLGYSGQYRALSTVLVVPRSANLPRDANFYQQFGGESVRIVGITDDVDAARARLQRQEIDLLVVAPSDLEQNFLSGQQSAIDIEYNELDPVRDNYARFIAYRQVQELNRALIEQVIGQGEQYILQSTGAQPPITIPPQVIAAPMRPEPRNLAPISPNVIAFFSPAVLASVFFSGFVLPLDQFVTPLRIASYALPVTHGIQLLQDFMLRGATNESWELLVLGAIGVLLFLLTWTTVRRNLRSAS